MTLTAGTRLGPYEILAPLGAGGMGEVYRARDTKLNREVAVKVLPERLWVDGAALARFEREARAVAALSHPNILSIFDFGEERGVRFAVNELLREDGDLAGGLSAVVLEKPSPGYTSHQAMIRRGEAGQRVCSSRPRGPISFGAPFSA